MGRIIASTYEVLDEIGSGGGGIVYLAKHLRLGKLVVLKADRRDLSASSESLSREVSILKNLSHTYIPQVYDYFTEDGVVYTVIDYIEGESLDKPLKRGERVAQHKLVEWACEVLEALVYLHGQTPGILHADIKPSNIMVTPAGDIRLIDFNIALLLRENGAVRVGFSRGYASPEHYGIDYSNLGKTVIDDPETQLSDPATSVKSSSSGDSENPRGRTILLDVRSDIYSLGATLYHLVSGTRPAGDAKDVTPLRPGEISGEICRIINKAMEPDPNRRYQTAAEMLYDLEHLHEQDPRTRRLRRARTVVTAVFALAFLIGGALSLLGLQQAKRAENARLLAEQSRDALQRGDPILAASLASSAIPDKLSLLDPAYVPEARAALADALGVYDLSDGFRATLSPALSTETLKLSLSPEGSRLCALCAWEMAVFDTESGERLVLLPIEPSALSSAAFLDEDRIVYAGQGALCLCDLREGKDLWQGAPATGIALSGDGGRIAAVCRDDPEARVYNTAGELLKTVSFEGRRQRVVFNDTFADPGDNLFSLNLDGTLLAASFADGSLVVYDLVTDEYIEVCPASDYTHFEGGFCGKYLAYSAIGGDSSVFTLVDMEALRFVGSIPGTTRFRLQVDESGIYMARDNLLVSFDPETLTDRELAFTEKPITAFRHSGDFTIVATEDKHFTIFDRSAGEVKIDRVAAEYSCDHVDLSGGIAVVGSMDSPTLRLLRLEGHAENQLFSYDPAYLHSEARLSADGEHFMLFRYDRFRVCSADGRVICDVDLPDAEHVYDQQFRRQDGDSYLEVIWYDGTVRHYSAADGSVIREETREKPDETLYEEHFTSRYRISSPLHGAPAAYDRKSGGFVRELEKDAYLTYVTEVGDYIITQYTTAQSERYGLLLDQELQTLATLPGLCDVVDGRLIFDYACGDLRETHVYSLTELLKLAGR